MHLPQPLGVRFGKQRIAAGEVNRVFAVWPERSGPDRKCITSAGVVTFAGLVDQDAVMKKTKTLYHGHRFPASIISHAVRWYFRFQLSLRDIGESPSGQSRASESAGRGAREKRAVR